jgi:hypothetical protein
VAGAEPVDSTILGPWLRKEMAHFAVLETVALRVRVSPVLPNHATKMRPAEMVAHPDRPNHQPREARSMADVNIPDEPGEKFVFKRIRAKRKIYQQGSREGWIRSNQKKAELLGMPAGTATGRLRKAIMFDFCCRLKENVCFRCQKLIDNIDDFSIEHKESWQFAPDPVALFFDLENIAFSHLQCNSAAIVRPTRKFANRVACDKAHGKKNQAKRVQSRKIWRQRRRAAGLPYS